jgi:hypothetical protein
LAISLKHDRCQLVSMQDAIVLKTYHPKILSSQDTIIPI